MRKNDIKMNKKRPGDNLAQKIKIQPMSVDERDDFEENQFPDIINYQQSLINEYNDEFVEAKVREQKLICDLQNLFEKAGKVSTENNPTPQLEKIPRVIYPDHPLRQGTEEEYFQKCLKNAYKKNVLIQSRLAILSLNKQKLVKFIQKQLEERDAQGQHQVDQGRGSAASSINLNPSSGSMDFDAEINVSPDAVDFNADNDDVLQKLGL